MKMEKKIKVLGIACSTHKSSRSEAMMREVLKVSEQYGAEIEIIRLSEKKIGVCESCASEKVEKCTYPCIHTDNTNEVLAKIVECDAIAFSGAVHWGTLSSPFGILIEKITALENNENDIWKKTGREPLEGKPCAIFVSKEYEGASMAIGQAMWVLNRLGFLLLPYAGVLKPAVLEKKIVRFGARVLGYDQLDWIPNTIRLHGRNLALLPLLFFMFDDHAVDEPRS
ncbi:MAG: flavodoxin family protein [Candidatus Portnoybacteria bacterium]|nr:flavodoxin family protein [Candidatus Portnoybacteria bacterium]